MKKLLLIMVLSVLTNWLQAQTWAEWTRQKKTQIKYLIQQIAALKVYGDYINKGYGIVNDGLHTIDQIKSGDFNLHEEHFETLQKVNPNVVRNPKTKQIVMFQNAIMAIANKAGKNAANSEWITPEERSYVQKVYTNLSRESLQVLKELYAVTEDEVLEANDANRETRIDALYEDMIDKYKFAQDFSNGMSVLVLQRAREKAAIKRSQSLYGLK